MRTQGCNANGEPMSCVYVEHIRVYAPYADDGLTRQEFADECDINVLMAGYERTGVLNHFNGLQPQYFDASDVPDLQRAHDVTQAAQAAFMTLSAAVRKEFDNDPIRWASYAADPANVDQMRKWGLASPAPVDPPPMRVEVVPAPAEPAGAGK